MGSTMFVVYIFTASIALEHSVDCVRRQDAQNTIFQLHDIFLPPAPGSPPCPRPPRTAPTSVRRSPRRPSPECVVPRSSPDSARRSRVLGAVVLIRELVRVEAEEPDLPVAQLLPDLVHLFLFPLNTVPAGLVRVKQRNALLAKQKALLEAQKILQPSVLEATLNT